MNPYIRQKRLTSKLRFNGLLVISDDAPLLAAQISILTTKTRSVITQNQKVQMTTAVQ